MNWNAVLVKDPRFHLVVPQDCGFPPCGKIIRHTHLSVGWMDLAVKSNAVDSMKPGLKRASLRLKESIHISRRSRLKW
eukprot:9722601-Prorocentrum_lima.AAC.1